jgi:hypothetical protein
MAETPTPAAIMREAYVEEVAKYSHIPRKVMDMEQVMEAGFRAALRALADMEPTDEMREAASDAFQDGVCNVFYRIAKAYILAAASEGEAQE